MSKNLSDNTQQPCGGWKEGTENRPGVVGKNENINHHSSIERLSTGTNPTGIQSTAHICASRLCPTPPTTYRGVMCLPYGEGTIPTSPTLGLWWRWGGIVTGA